MTSRTHCNALEEKFNQIKHQKTAPISTYLQSFSNIGKNLIAKQLFISVTEKPETPEDFSSFTVYIYLENFKAKLGEMELSSFTI